MPDLSTSTEAGVYEDAMGVEALTHALANHHIRVVRRPSKHEARIVCSCGHLEKRWTSWGEGKP